MAALNIDASPIQRHSVSQAQERLIQMQNGCVCCTLRGDLLEELAALFLKDDCDYIVIESTGIGEPMQVAETFTEEFSVAMIERVDDDSSKEEEQNEKQEQGARILQQIASLGGLQNIAKLDTLITVVDSFNFFDNFSTTEFIIDGWGKENVDLDDEHTVTDLMVDQNEFANAIIINKTGSVDEDTRKRLSPSARIFEANQCRVDVAEVIGTKSFCFEKAAPGMGWLRSLHETTKHEIDRQIKIGPKPETEEYGISIFVYHARRPFHPKRLYKLIYDKFVLMEGQIEEEKNEMDQSESDEAQEQTTEGSDEDTEGVSDEGEHDYEGMEQSDFSDLEMEDAEDEFSKSIPPDVVARNKRSDACFKGLLRSKSFLWLATRPTLHGEWSQVGTMLTLQGGGPGFCSLEEAQWPDDQEVWKIILDDFKEPWGDSRQELVFIGEGLNEEGLRAKLDSCLLMDSEMKKWMKIMKSSEDMSMIAARLARTFEGNVLFPSLTLLSTTPTSATIHRTDFCMMEDEFENWPEAIPDADEHEHEHGARAHKH